MFQNRRHTVFALLVLSLIAPLVFFSTDLRSWQSNRLTTVWQELIYPFEYAWHWSNETLSKSWREYIALQDAARDNDALQAKVAELQTKVLDYEEAQLEIARLRSLLGFAKKYNRELLVAEVVGTPQETQFLSLRISRGSLDGVSIGMAVVTAQGILGRIIRVGLKFADVQVITDASFNLDVLLQRTRVRGVLQGIAGQRCALNLHRRAEIRIGDTLISSGIVGGFPKGLPVGQVMRISYAADNVHQVITVQPWVDYRRVEEVFVLRESSEEIEKIVNTAGSDWLRRSTNKGGG